jgi:hypothetical protein
VSALRGPGYRRRSRRFLLGAVAVFGLGAGAVLVRSRPEPYVPGAENQEITRTLDRSLPARDVSEPPDGGPRARAAGARGGSAARPGGVTFTDVALAAGLRFQHFTGTRSTQLPEDMGSGAAWGDYDGDGDPDLFLVNEAGPLGDGPEAAAAARSALFRNDGGRFTDVTDAVGLEVTGWGMGAAWGDYDGDFDLDLFVTRYGTNLLFRNERGRFTDVSSAAGVGGLDGFWTGAAWGDYDRDGDLDLYVCGYVRFTADRDAARQTSLQFRSQVPFTLNPSSYPPERNLLYRNEGGRFREVARDAGVDNPAGRSLSAAWADFDLDGWPDLYVANDVSDNAMFVNLGNGRFRDASHAALVADYRGAMGLGIGDWENDGDFDIFITHWIAQENALYENQRGVFPATADAPMRFIDYADAEGLGQIALDFIGWGTAFFDYDNDGRLDLLVVNGSTFQDPADPTRLIPMKNQLFWNAGHDKGFYETGATAGSVFQEANVGRGLAVADHDGDGDLDALVTVNGGRPRLLRNDGGSRRSWLRVVLRGPARRASGRGPATSSFATGALVRVSTGGASLLRQVGDGPSYLCQSPPGEVFFGLGDAETVDRLEVAWPSGHTQSVTGLPARATVTLREGQPPQVVPRGRP